MRGRTAEKQSTVVEYAEIINAQHYALITGCRWKKSNYYFKLILIWKQASFLIYLGSTLFDEESLKNTND